VAKQEARALHESAEVPPEARCSDPQIAVLPSGCSLATPEDILWELVHPLASKNLD
jgi:hypothetical protein